ncbi:hypothetical protein H0H92_008215 [Tricholoma furcatifolium]|nr:hypothetical protein H0H92_008215 [Tricholoma furcatifolium]
MPPRKASTGAEPTRRSSRIVSQPKDEATAAATTTTKKAASKKRTAADAGAGDDAGEEVPAEDGSSAPKKAKADDAGDSEAAPKLSLIDIGDVLPAGLTLKNEKGEDVDVAGLAAEKGVVFFLVPKADTPGCTNQACGFRDIYPDFTSLDYTVYCLSADSPAAQTKWQTKKELPYPLISDPKRVLISALGAGEGGKTKRSHFIFEKGGKLLDKKIPVKPVDSPKLALEFIQNL